MGYGEDDISLVSFQSVSKGKLVKEIFHHSKRKNRQTMIAIRSNTDVECLCVWFQAIMESVGNEVVIWR